MTSARRAAPSSRGAFPAAFDPGLFGSPGTQPAFSFATRCHFYSAFSSPMRRKTKPSHPSISDERNTMQMIENNHSRYALSVNFLSTARTRFLGGRSFSSDIKAGAEHPPFAFFFPRALRTANLDPAAPGISKFGDEPQERSLVAALCRDNNERQRRGGIHRSKGDSAGKSL